ncbi:hypothetical protein [Micromonospora sp. NPDC048063]|uniref:hypothetical protein n=1 Tax=Micromonospora sp. NPDC048063 TaxID=3364256 RepID=UPI0037187E02
MGWVQWLIVVGLIVFVGWGIVFWIMQRRAGSHKSHYSDGCAKPLVEKAFRADGSPKNILPRPGDGEVDDLEHLLEHRRERE